MMRSRLLAVLAFVLVACSSTPTVIPTKNLERPVDMSLVCLEMTSGTTQLSGRPMSVCHQRNALDPTVNLSGQRNLGTFGFIINAGRGELAVADMDQGRMLDLTPKAPGYGMLPVGGNPESVAASQDGCWVAIGNRTTCDFTLVDPARLLSGTFSTSSSQAVASTQSPDTQTGAASHQVTVRTQSGRALHAAIGEVAFLPPAFVAPDHLCQSDDHPRAVATFPGCDMVAVLDFSFGDSSATIASAFYVGPDGAQDAGGEPVCPDDCSALPASPVSDGGASSTDAGGEAGTAVDSGSGAGQSSYYLQPLTLTPDGARLFVASLDDTAITSFDLRDRVLANPQQLQLAENPVGVARLRLAVDPYASSLDTDGNLLQQGQPLTDRGAFFLYAFTRDDSIRVVDITNPVLPIECDVNVLVTPDKMSQACFPIGSAPRRPLADGPGLRIPTFLNADSPPPVPRDIAFADLRAGAGDTNYHALNGQFGFVLASNGQVYVLNLAPSGEDGQTLPPNLSCATHLANGAVVPPAATNSFRDVRDVGQCSRTPRAISIAPQRSAPSSDQAFATTASFSSSEGPLIESFLFGDTTTRWVDFPDTNNIVSKAWDVVWEGPLPRASRVSGLIQPGTDNAGLVSDSGADFCSSGVEPGDILMFAGCNQDSDCQPDDQFTCQSTVSGGRMMCLPIQSSLRDPLVTRCSDFLGSRMRYEIVKVQADKLTLGLKLDEVPKTTLNPCKEDKDCRVDAEHGKFAVASPDAGPPHAFECLEVHANDRRCVERCSSNSDCRPGHVCQAVPGVEVGGSKLCVEAPPIDTACFPQPMTAYSVRAGHSFVINGSSLPSIRTSKAVGADRTCQLDTSGDPTLINRIPLNAPVCPDSFMQSLGTDPTTGMRTADAKLVQLHSAARGYNPCLYFAPSSESPSPATSDAGASSVRPVHAFFQNPQIRFAMTNLDQYAGDLLSIHFELQYGFLPLNVSVPYAEVQVTLGTRILTGPTMTPESPIRRSPKTGDNSFTYLYVVDQGQTKLTSGSRGQVLRINPRYGSSELASFDTAMTGSTPFQLQ
jgi:hypothetical protein